jgi:nucleotide-binding universal stress UspA family protein
MSDTPGSDKRARRKFLVVIDGTSECKVALRYAARRALHTGGLVTLLTVIERPDIQEWAAVEQTMREEARAEAERLLHEHAKVVNDITGAMPEFVIREGTVVNELVSFIKEDGAVSILILGAGSGKEGPGPLVARVAGPVAGHYPIPVTVVPVALTDAQVDALT